MNGIDDAVEKKVNKYIDRLERKKSKGQVSYIKDNKSNLKKVNYNKDYIKISGYCLNFYPGLSSVKLKCKNASGDIELSTSDCKFLKGKDIVNIGNIKSGDDFSILIPKNKNITEVTEATFTTKTTTAEEEGIIYARIAVLDCEDDQTFQNLMIVKAGMNKGEPSNASVTIPGIIEKGSLKVIKQNVTSVPNVLVPNVPFKIKKVDNGLYVHGSLDAPELGAEGEATVYATGADGSFTINNLPTGTYQVIEQDYLGYKDQNPNETVIVTAGSTAEKPVVITKKNIQLTTVSGYVWNDGNDTTKDSTRDNLRGAGDKPMEGIHLLLGGLISPDQYNALSNEGKQWFKPSKDAAGNPILDENGNPVSYQCWEENDTNSDGYYEYKGVPSDILQYICIDFYYDGVKYAPIEVNITDPNGSKGKESPDRRNNLNQVFGRISNKEGSQNRIQTNQDIDEYPFTEPGIINDREKYKFSEGLEYTQGWNNEKQSYESVMNDWVGTSYYNAANDAALRTFARVGETNPAASDVYTEYTLKGKYDEIVASGATVINIENVNLGLYNREQPDLVVLKDIENVQLEINGYGHTYNYDQKQQIIGDENISGENLAGVKFGEKFGNINYNLPVYKSDYQYKNTEDPSKELKAYITYKISIVNLSSTVDSKVNNLIDYYDIKYDADGESDIRVNTELKTNESDGKLYNSDQISVSRENYNEKYKKLNINMDNITINPGITKWIYIQFELSRDQIAEIVQDQTDNKNIFDNVAEIGSYTSYYAGSTQLYAGIDKDSAPGNAIPGQKETYDNDTDFAPAFKIEQKAQERTIKGKVFLDQIVAPEGYQSDQVMTGQERKGSGQYDDGDIGVKGIQVDLIGGTLEPQYTDENGDFEFSGFIPDEYSLKYTWGGQEINVNESNVKISVEDYKGTIYDNEERYNGNLQNKLWYRDNVDTRYSDAVDDYEKREEIDDEYRTVSWQLENNINKIGDNGKTMESTTPVMNIRIENTDQTNSGLLSDYASTSSGIQVLSDAYIINNVDFGIAERAKQKVEITKRVKHIKLQLENESIVSEAEFKYNDKGELIATDNSSAQYMTYVGVIDKMQKNNEQNGFIKIELDNELIQGATLEVEYEILFNNKSERDYASEKYYKFGISDENDLIKIKPSTIIDYLDEDWSFTTNQNGTWEAVNSYEDLMRTYNGNAILNQEKIFKTPNEYNKKTSGRIVLINNGYDDKEIAPDNNLAIPLKVSKILTTTDDIELENDTEIVKMEIPKGGRPMKDIPGKYYPGASLTVLSDKAEKVIITPSTGKDLNFVLPIAVGVIALITLGAGVILIKKKVVDNK